MIRIGPSKGTNARASVHGGLHGRTVTVYEPPARPAAVIFAGDGQRLAAWGADLESTGSVPTMVVGVHSSDDEVERIQEYVLGASSPEFQFDEERFFAHERFFVDVLSPWVTDRFGLEVTADRSAVLGVSAGAELALAMGMRHPDRFATVLAASPGAGYKPPAHMAGRLPRTYLLAGEQEPFFRENAARWRDALEHAGAAVLMRQRPGSHGGAFWRAELPRMIEWAFPSLRTGEAAR